MDNTAARARSVIIKYVLLFLENSKGKVNERKDLVYHSYVVIKILESIS